MSIRRGPRPRQWDGHDTMLRDDLSYLRGNHLVQFGGSYQRNYDFFTRNDDGIGIDATLVCQMTNGTGIAFSAANRPAGLPSSQNTTWDQIYDRRRSARRIVRSCSVRCTA